ncbi:DUF6792 domain-containing protein [Virgibacillus pantothenticus]|uniref:DUF6792 domain-containing protein n=2 Tax=Virgibacillus pantothenticus TaxID=1473 RepID=UPI0025B26466|nr:DUF6792 domain-containing protein [Virgibacillus pantothenticus]
MSNRIIHSPELRLRLTQLGYDDKLSKKEFIEKVKRIYLEETGNKLEADIKVYTSKEARVGEQSGYDGIAIYLDAKENKKDEVYVVSQGSTDIKDWDYNIKAMFVGKEYSQAKATNKFVLAAQHHFKLNNNEDSTPVIGLSHSLAHDNNTTAHLMYNTFDEIYSVNGAQTNYYQLFFANAKFANAVRSHFSLSLSENDYFTIYDIDPNKLRQFAENYYKDKAKNIHQIISKDDPLYAASTARGFFTLGNVEMVDTNPDYPGLRSLVEDIPDEVMKEFQELAIQYTTASNQGGVNAAMQEILGVNMDVVNKIDDNMPKTYMTDQAGIDEMIRQLDKKVPGLLKRVKTITSNSNLIFSRLEDAGYISNQQKQLIVKEFTKIETELEGIQETLSRWVDVRDTGNFFGFHSNTKNKATF